MQNRLRREPMAPSLPDHLATQSLPRSLSHCRVRLYHDPHLPLGPDWLHGLLQGCEAESQGAAAQLERRGRGEALSVLQ